MFFSLTNTESKFHVQLGSQTRSDLHLDLIDLLSVTSPSNSHRIQQIARVASIANSIAQTLLLRLLIKERINQIDRLHQLIAFIAHNLVHIVIRELLRYSSFLFFAAYASCSRADRTKCPCSTQDICWAAGKPGSLRPASVRPSRSWTDSESADRWTRTSECPGSGTDSLRVAPVRFRAPIRSLSIGKTEPEKGKQDDPHSPWLGFRSLHCQATTELISKRTDTSIHFWLYITSTSREGLVKGKYASTQRCFA